MEKFPEIIAPKDNQEVESKESSIWPTFFIGGILFLVIGGSIVVASEAYSQKLLENANDEKRVESQTI